MPQFWGYFLIALQLWRLMRSQLSNSVRDPFLQFKSEVDLVSISRTLSSCFLSPQGILEPKSRGLLHSQVYLMVKPKLLENYHSNFIPKLVPAFYAVLFSFSEILSGTDLPSVFLLFSHLYLWCSKLPWFSVAWNWLSALYLSQLLYFRSYRTPFSY